MGETTQEETTQEEITQEEITGPKIVAFIAVLILCGESVNAFLTYTTSWDIIFGIVSIILAIVIFISLEFIDLSPVKIPYYWWLTLIFGILLIALAFLTTSGFGVTFKPYLGGVLLLTGGIMEILGEKKNIVNSKFVAIVGAGFTLYECINIFILYSFVGVANIINPIVGIIIAVILLIIALDLVDIKIPFNWWVVLTIGFIVFTWVSPLYAGIAGTVIMISFILIILGF
ncbi:hypothetical protein LCGC14_0696010 [marine sediment metagenome]|uniref:Uncharacterized protein n=1 Tax=marine sediment metagenome TaxID=412755 RepID=A0A0F9QJ60_9ZZZZ